MQKIKQSLPLQIFIALGLGIVAGLILLAVGGTDFAINYIKPFGTIFLNLLKFIVVPIVITSIVQGVVSLSDIKKVGTIGLRTIIYYFCTTAFAITIGLIFANLFKGTYKVLQTSDLAYEAAEPTSFMDTIVNIFPSNLFQPMVESSMLQIIVIALFIGFGIIIAGDKAKVFNDWINSAYEVFMVIMRGIIKVTPIAVFCLITPVVAENGPQVLGSLAMVLLTAYVAYAVHMFLTYSLAVKFLGHFSPAKFFKGAMPGFLFAFSSTSSIGTLPVSMECVESMGGRKDVASFTLPLATINMDGTAIYQGVCAIFIASCFGIHLTFSQMITIVLTATLASVGTAGTPGAGMIMLAMVLQSVGLPVEGIALVAGVDRIFDMGRTGVNVVGDMSAAIIISDYENRREAKEGKKAQ